MPNSIQSLVKDGTLNILCNILSHYKQLKDFENLLRNITGSKIQPDNICWLLNLHLARMTSVTTTTQMCWDSEIIEFFSVVYLLFGASCINVLRGPMHFSDIVMENVERGKFDPEKARINIPIPSIKTLQCLETGYKKEIPVGLVQHTLKVTGQMAAKGSQYILSFDGKMVAHGLKGESFGDIDLWGIEKPIPVQKSLEVLFMNLEICENLKRDVSFEQLSTIIADLEKLLQESSKRIRNLRQRIEGEHYLRLKIVKMSQNQNLDSRQQYSYRMQLSFLNEHSARCDSHVGRGLHLNMRILEALAMCRNNSDVFTPSKIVSLHEQNNAYHLFDTSRNSLFFDLSLPTNFDIIKQRSPEWFDLRKKAKVTGSSLYKALGLDSLSLLKQHHYKFVKKRPPKDFSPEVQLRLQYGQENEKHAVSTLIGGILPALIPHCSAFLEVGAVMLSVYGEDNFIEVSADGVVRCLDAENCSEDIPNNRHYSVLPIEIKTFYPDPSKPLQPHYTPPVRYVPQCLAEMAAYKSNSLWLISYTLNSTAVHTLHFDQILWDKMMSIAYDLRGGEKPKVPVKLHSETKNLKDMIKKYTYSHCTFLYEIPSFRGIETFLRESEILSAHSFCDVHTPGKLQIGEIDRKIKSISFEGKPYFESVHNTLRQEAQEVLVFMLSDHNRQHNEFLPYSMPLGYAMKGKTLRNCELCYLINYCRNTLKSENIPILCEVYDGQWQNICMTHENGEPLTKLRLTKQTWQRVQKYSKNKCFQEVCLASKCKSADLDTMSKAQKLFSGTYNFHNLKITKQQSGG